MDRNEDSVSPAEGALMGLTPACIITVFVVYAIIRIRNWQQRRSGARSPFDNPDLFNQPNPPSASTSTQTTNPSNSDGHGNGNGSDRNRDKDGASDNIPKPSTSMHASAASHLGNVDSSSAGAASSSHVVGDVIDMTLFSSSSGNVNVNSFTNRSYTSPDKNTYASPSHRQEQGPPSLPKDPLAGLTPNLPKTDLRKTGVKSSKKLGKTPAIPPVNKVSPMPTPESSPRPTPNKARLSTLAPKPQPTNNIPVFDTEPVYENVDELLMEKSSPKAARTANVDTILIPVKTSALMDWDNSAHRMGSFHGVSVLPVPNVNLTPSRCTRSRASNIGEYFELSRNNRAKVARFVPASIS